MLVFMLVIINSCHPATGIGLLFRLRAIPLSDAANCRLSNSTMSSFPHSLEMDGASQRDRGRNELLLDGTLDTSDVLAFYFHDVTQPSLLDGSYSVTILPFSSMLIGPEVSDCTLTHRSGDPDFILVLIEYAIVTLSPRSPLDAGSDELIATSLQRNGFQYDGSWSLVDSFLGDDSLQPLFGQQAVRTSTAGGTASFQFFGTLLVTQAVFSIYAL